MNCLSGEIRVKVNIATVQFWIIDFLKSIYSTLKICDHIDSVIKFNPKISEIDKTLITKIRN